MKKNVIILGLLLLGVVCPQTNISAQNVKVTVNVNKQPAWGPTGYDYAGYYYFPDLNIYFDINNSLFYYASGSKWVSNKYLPDNYRKYDLYSLYKVVINSNTPWQQNKTHKKNYAKFKKDKTQTPIRNSQEDKYKTSRSNTNTWVNAERNSDKNDKKKAESSNNNKNKQNNNSKNSNMQSGRK